jgi:hypothetical protein
MKRYFPGAAMGLVLISASCLPGMAQEPPRPPQEQVNPPQDVADVPQSDNPELVVPAGTVLSVVLNSYLNSRSSQVGDRFYADIMYPIYIQQRMVIPKGSTVRGTVTQVQRPGRIKGKARMAIRIDNVLLPNGIDRDMVVAFHGIHGPGTEKIDRKSETVSESGSQGQDVGQILGAAGGGAIIGAVADGGREAAIGAGAGAAVGLATVLFTRGKELVLGPGTQFDVELRQPMRFAYGELDFTDAQMNMARPSSIPRPRDVRNTQKSRYPRVPGITGMPQPFPVQ